MHKKPFPSPADARGLVDEADIGSGEKTPGQLETEKIISEIPPLPAGNEEGNEEAEAAGDVGGAGRTRREHNASLDRDEPSENLEGLDPVPPEGS